MKESSYEKKENSYVISLGVRSMFLVFLFTFQFINSQEIDLESSFEQFDSYFKTIDSPIVIDDITVRYSENKRIPYNLINKFTTDDYGLEGIVVGDKNMFNFYAIGKIVLNEDFTFYIFSKESNYPDEKVYSAYVILIEDIFFEALYSVYYNSNLYKIEDNMGTYINFKNWVQFNLDKNILEHFQFFEEEGSVARTYETYSIDVKKIKRLNPYSVKFNQDFYKRTKVLMPLDWIKNSKPGQSLIQTGNIKLSLKKSYFVDYLVGQNTLSSVYYLNELMGGDLLCYEIIEERFRGSILSSYDNVSQYEEKPNGKFYIDYFELTNKTSERINRK